MTRNETATIIGVLISAYPRSGIQANDTTLSLWTEMLADLSAKEVTLAVKALIATLKYPPSIADVRGAVMDQRRQARNEKTAGEAWRDVYKAISRYGYNRPEDARNALDAAIWDAVQMLGGWTNVCLSDAGLEVISAQFERRYNDALKRKHYTEQVPDKVQKSFAELMNNLKMLEG